MTDKVQKIREEVARLKEETSIGLSEHENGVEQGRIEIIEALSLFLDSLQEEPVSEEFEKALAREWQGYNDRGAATVDALEDNTQELAFAKGFYRGTKWQKGNLWKPSDSDDLPEIDREVVVLIKYDAQRNIHDEEYPTYRVGFGHRPNPNGWDGKNIDTNEVTHYTPKLYDRGGWNAPNIVYWLDTRLPYEENKIIK